MASVCSGKATSQKWTARLHVRSVRACVHALSASKQRLIPPGLTVTTALFGQSNSATIFKSLLGQVYPNTVRNKQDILEKFRLVASVKFLGREGGSIDGKNQPAVAILLRESITPALFWHPTAHILQNQGQKLRQTQLGELERCSFPSPSVKLPIRTPITFRAKLIR